MSTLFKVFAIMLIILFCLAGSCKGLIHFIYHHMDCNEFNIDHIEVRTGIDVPKTVSSICHLSEDQTKRKVDFVLDTTVVDIDRWLKMNKFAKSGKQYVKLASLEDHDWQATFERDKHQLSVQIVYK